MPLIVAWMAAASLAQSEPASARPNSSNGEQLAPVVDELIVIAPKRNEEPNWSKSLDFDVRGDFGRGNNSPSLRRRPSNGCKVMAGGATSVIGKSGAAGGLVCTKRF